MKAAHADRNVPVRRVATHRIQLALLEEGEAIALFPESKEEKDRRRDFYDTTPARSGNRIAP